MQIREISLKELETVYTIINELYPDLTYKEFEDLIYDMRHMNYQMFGVFQRESLITFAGVVIQTTFAHKRHLKVLDFKTSSLYNNTKYDKIMKDYIADYAKVAMCEMVKYED
jgi:hypothetical protein